ncbi:uncharacterized protein LOC124456047 isoform X2 [Xenia sp. Carnegie-2017]|uniref:uncharacterized protein LOC124456047 isoform X2 n=1 Tax=Xenia sp. Carnegie-2017 TaxID=2897299 RepID=UPI001F048C97|nr:uncharacterized protein LOC124456047 isoform X2 [Xenia sp. Carnegie-2017]
METFSIDSICGTERKTLTVSNKKIWKMSYRKHKKLLYVNEGSVWRALLDEKQMHQMQQQFRNQKKTIIIQERLIQVLTQNITTLSKELELHNDNFINQATHS